MTEHWAEIADFSAYRVSDIGNVWSRKRKRLLKPHVIWRRKHATVTVALKRDSDGKWMSLKIGHLVLLSFGKPRPEGYVMRHLNGDGEFNFIHNLTWGTQADNIADAMRHGTAAGAKGERNSHAKLDPEDVWLIRKMLAFSLHHKNIASVFGVTKSTIDFINQKRSWAHI